MTENFLTYSKAQGNDLSTPVPAFGFPGLKPGDHWCVCAPRWKQAYEDGMRFVQFYFGLPIAMVIISAVFVPIYYRLNVFTAYEYLEQRFDVRVRVLAAVLFMIGRGLAAGISLYAPAIILSSLLGSVMLKKELRNKPRNKKNRY